MPRYVPGTITMAGHTFHFIDGASVLSAWQEIFERECFFFPDGGHVPRIVDAGANVGIATLYFKSRYPAARIVAIEPDPAAAEALRRNVESFGLPEVEIVEAALGARKEMRTFFREGADAGSLVGTEDQEKIRVQVLKLSEFLKEPVDFLKLDIEGAENEVLKEAKALLPRVQRLFVEYHAIKGTKPGLSQLLGLLERAGFRIYPEAGGRINQPFAQPISMYRFDLLVNVYAVRDHAVAGRAKTPRIFKWRLFS